MQNNPTPEKEETSQEQEILNSEWHKLAISHLETCCVNPNDEEKYTTRYFDYIAGYNAHKQRMGEVVKEALQAGYSVLTGNETPNELDLVIRAIKLVADALPQPPKTT